MRTSLLIILAMVAIAIVSCQKEIDWGTENAANQQLIKIRSITGADSTVITYSYDGQQRLIGEITVGASGGTSLNMTLTINRNSSGVITTTVQHSDALLSAGVDSLVTRYYYDNTSSKYTAAAFDLNVGGFAVTDSAVYTYDGSGRITSELHYIISGIIPTFQALKNDYTYSATGANLISMAQSAVTNPGDPLDPVATITYTFDAKTDPLLLKNEGILLGRVGYYNANNATKTDYSDLTDPTQNFTFDYTYKYNSANKPDSSYSTKTPGGQVTASKYYYQ